MLFFFLKICLTYLGVLNLGYNTNIGYKLTPMLSVDMPGCTASCQFKFVQRQYRLGLSNYRINLTLHFLMKGIKKKLQFKLQIHYGPIG